MSISLLVSLCVILVSIVFFTVGHEMTLPIWKRIFIIVVGSLSGIIGLRVMRYIECGRFEGFSFYGAHFFGGLGIVHACLLVRTSLDEMTNMLDVSAPGLCASLVVLKFKCFIDDCCKGIVLKINSDNSVIRFPSQIVECLFALFLMVLFLVLIRKGKHRGSVWYLYMIYYGIGRFILNLLRETEPWILGMAAGNFWSLVSIAIGLILLYIHRLRVVTAEEKKAAIQNRRAHKAH